ncbi:MAG: hypothetical protein SynsKO_27950 [Synoicihabitans sp.]
MFFRNLPADSRPSTWSWLGKLIRSAATGALIATISQAQIQIDFSDSSLWSVVVSGDGAGSTSGVIDKESGLEVARGTGSEGYTLLTATLTGSYDLSAYSDLVLTFVSGSASSPSSAIDFSTSGSFGSPGRDGFSISSASHGLLFSTAGADSAFEGFLDMEKFQWDVAAAAAQGQDLAFDSSLDGNALSDLVIQLQVDAENEILKLGSFLIGGTTTIGSSGSIDLRSAGAVNPNRFVVADRALLFNDLGDASFVNATGGFELTQDLSLRTHQRAVVEVSGAITESIPGSSLNTLHQVYYDKPVPLILTGNNSYTGGTKVGDGTSTTDYRRGTLIFGNAGAVPDTGLLSTGLGGYLGGAFVPDLQSEIVDRIDSSNFHGTLGLDSYGTAAPAVFSDALDLSALTGFQGLGSATVAELAATPIIPNVTGPLYAFGQGPGTLRITASLTDQHSQSTRLVFRGGPDQTMALTAYLSGANTFTGDVEINRTAVVVDHPGALPSTATVALGQYAYVGVTENFRSGSDVSDPVVPFDTFLSQISLDQALYAAVGVDSADVNSPRTVLEDIDLSLAGEQTNQIYFGTRSKVVLEGGFTPPTDAPLQLTGILGGHLVVNSTLTDSMTNAKPVEIGLGRLWNDVDVGVVELGGESSFSSGVLLRSGELRLSHNNALGTGILTIGSHLEALTGSDVPFLTAGVDEVTIGNDIRFDSGSTYLRLGALESANELILTGNIEGTSDVFFSGQSPVTLAGDNSFRFLTTSGDGPETLTLASDNASGGNGIFRGSTQVALTSAQPTFEHIYGDFSNVTLRLAEGSNLLIDNGPQNTTSPTYLALALTGTLQDFSTANIYQTWFYDGSITGEGSVQKSGFDGQGLGGSNSISGETVNTYTGGTLIDGGYLVARSNGALGTGAVTVESGGTLAIARDTVIANPLVLNGGTLAGVGKIADPAGVVLDNGDELAPGTPRHDWVVDFAPGQLGFETDLTFGPDSLLSWKIIDPNSSAGVGWDHVAVDGKILFTATPISPLVIDVQSLSSVGVDGALASFDKTVWQSWILASSTEGILGFDGLSIQVDYADFLAVNTIDPGFFFLDSDGFNLVMNFQPVPEPSTWGLMMIGLTWLFWRVRPRSARRS